ncbi:MAG: hypothetical protein ABL926_01995 [Novosphingobium sp.]|uniref:hypothetical protein n=1 Tax=Novosphingobium sp. TaxID=1874826 RepID=UPI0032B7E7F0
MILDFIGSVGIAVEFRANDGPSLLDGIAVRRGSQCLDPAIPANPGDLLHEAGQIAVTAPELRPWLGEIAADGGDCLVSRGGTGLFGASRRAAPSSRLQGWRGRTGGGWSAGQPFGVRLLAW